MTKEILRSTTVTVGAWMLLVGSLMFLACANYLSGQRAAILLLGGGSVAVVVGLISQVNDKRGFSHLVHRIVDSHKTVALMALNTLIVFACVELAAAFVVHIWKKPVMTDEDLPRAHTSYYASQAWAKQYWREFHLSRPIRYREYILWRRAPLKGQFLNVDRDGIRVTPGAVCSAISYKVFAFGGSTMWGTGSPDWGTIPAYLQAEFTALRHGPVCVMNFGEAGFVSTQGVIALVEQLQSGNIPAVVSFYDGVNDVYAAYQSGRPTHQNFDKIAAKFEKGQTPSPAFVGWIESSHSFHLVNRLVADLRPKPPDRQELVTYKTMGINSATLSDAVVETYLSNYEVVDALARKHGFKFFFFWQPQIAMGDKSLTREEQEMRRTLDPALIELFESVYRRVEQVAKKYENLYDLADIFNALDSQIWIDSSHVTPVGNRLIADKMFGVITGRID